MVRPSREVINHCPEPGANDSPNRGNRRHESALPSLREFQFLHAMRECIVIVFLLFELTGVSVNFALKAPKVAPHVDEQIVNVGV
jgi:hypothetical protein